MTSQSDSVARRLSKTVSCALQRVSYLHSYKEVVLFLYFEVSFLKSRCLLKESTLGVFAENSFKGSAEVFVEDGVDDGVEAAVAVADPEKEREDRLGQLARFGTHGLQAVGKEEREPADDEHADHHRQHEGETLFPVHHGLTAS